MFDLQTTYMRLSLKTDEIDAVTMLRLRGLDLINVTDVLVNEAPVPFIVPDLESVLVAVPGEDLGGVRSVSLVREVEGGTSTEQVVVSGGTDLGGKVLLEQENAILSIRGKGYESADMVTVNGAAVPFTIVSTNLIYAEIPPAASSIDRVEVFGTTTSVSRESFFVYTMGQSPQLVDGPFKTASQFIKCLMTTGGTDIFEPDDPAGGFASWSGIQTSTADQGVLMSQIILRVQLIGAQFIAAQRARAPYLPASELLDSVAVVNFAVDPQDQTSIQLGLRLVMQDQASVVFDTLLGAVGSLVNEAV